MSEQKFELIRNTVDPGSPTKVIVFGTRAHALRVAALIGPVDLTDNTVPRCEYTVMEIRVRNRRKKENA